MKSGSPSGSSTAAQVPRWPGFFQRRGRSFLVRRENRNGLPSLSNASSDIRHSSGSSCPRQHSEQRTPTKTIAPPRHRVDRGPLIGNAPEEVCETNYSVTFFTFFRRQ